MNEDVIELIAVLDESGGYREYHVRCKSCSFLWIVENTINAGEMVAMHQRKHYEDSGKENMPSVRYITSNGDQYPAIISEDGRTSWRLE